MDPIGPRWNLCGSPPCLLTWLAFGSLQPILAILARQTWHTWQAWNPIAAVMGISGHSRPQIQEQEGEDQTELLPGALPHFGALELGKGKKVLQTGGIAWWLPGHGTKEVL